MIHLMNKDALSVLPWLGVGTIDCIITDPPYPTISGGSGPSDTHQRPTGMLAANDGRGGLLHNDVDIEDYAPMLWRVLRDPGHVWMFTNELNRRRIEDAMLAAKFRTHFLGGWIKQNATPNQWGMKNAELFFLFRKGSARGLYTPGIKQFIAAHNPVGKKIHPNEKPVELVQQMVEASSLAGQTVLDPFCGAGSVGVACRATGRRFVGIEIDPLHWAVAKGRLFE
jgi:DNA modification methylase